MCVLPPTISLLVAFFRRSCLPRFALFTCIFPLGRGREERVPPGGNGFHARREWAWAGVLGKSRGLGEKLEVCLPEWGRDSASQKGGVRQEPLDPPAPVSGGRQGRAGSLFTFDRGREERRFLNGPLPPASALLPPPYSHPPRTHSALGLNPLIQSFSKPPNFPLPNSQFLPPTRPSDLRLRE